VVFAPSRLCVRFPAKNNLTQRREGQSVHPL
jgi:hypothetical protein